jgi:hypothetical protein
MTNENKPVFTGEVEDWVTQDVLPRRVSIDEYRWIMRTGTVSSWGMTLIEPKMRDDISHGYIDCHGARLEVRCKRKDHPVLGKVGSRFISQHELNAEPRTRAWTFGTPAQTGHFLISFLDPALGSQEIAATSIWNVNEQFGETRFWFIYLGQTSDFADPVVQKAKYTLLSHTAEPFSKWCKDPADVQEKLDLGWIIVKEQEMQVPEWDR